jgi:hypothetical protein
MRWYENIGYEFDEISDGVFEQVIVNDKRTNKYQVVFDVFPDILEFRTKHQYSHTQQLRGGGSTKGELTI